MPLKPWYKVVTPREDLREGKPLDASEFAVHLDQVRDQRAPDVYRLPQQFFERTYLTKNLTGLAAEVIRRLSGDKTEANAVFNMTTQFGGGKTHALTLLYHLAENGPNAERWTGVRTLLEAAGKTTVPRARTAVFVGTEFDSLDGRGGADGTPVRKTPWGEIAWQLGGEKALAVLARHEEERTAPGGDVIRKFLPDEPCLILMDELMNYVSRTRKLGMGAQLYNFLQNLSEETRGRDNVVLAVSIPASEIEMNADDQADHERMKKLLDRLGKAVIMSAEGETSEIIRRRLFEWDERAVTSDGRVLLSREALDTCREYADWIVEHRQQLPSWFPVDSAREAMAATYPFHPVVLSVFERKWQALPRFQRTRGVLRLLALWVSRAYVEGFKGGHKDALIGLGTAPLEDTMFRTAVFEQLGEPRLEAAVTTDICGKKDAHAIRLDAEAVDAIKKTRLHRKAASSVFFESNGGSTRAEATVPEVRLAVGEPDSDIGNVETVLETLSASAYYLSVEKNRYRFSLSPNLNKLLADRRASIQTEKIRERVREEIPKPFPATTGLDRKFFPGKSGDVPERAQITLAVIAPDQLLADEARTLDWIMGMTRESGASARTFKSALIWCVPDPSNTLAEEARKLLAWEDIDGDADQLRLDEGQRRQLAENLKKAQRDLRECVWRSYKKLVMLGEDNKPKVVDLGLVHSSAADTMVTYILQRLRQDGLVETAVGASYLVRHWPGQMKEWSTRQVRDAFFASPQLPRLLNGDAIKDTIAKGVESGQLAYVGKSGEGYDPFVFKEVLNPDDVEISAEMYVVTREVAEAYLKAQDEKAKGGETGCTGHTDGNGDTGGGTSGTGTGQQGNGGATGGGTGTGGDSTGGGNGHSTGTPVLNASRLTWTGEIPAQKWNNFYLKVLAKLASTKGLKLKVVVELEPEGGVPPHQVQETLAGLRELGLGDDIQTT